LFFLIVKEKLNHQESRVVSSEGVGFIKFRSACRIPGFLCSLVQEDRYSAVVRPFFHAMIDESDASDSGFYVFVYPGFLKQVASMSPRSMILP
jgi:hypothetical protein